MPPIATDTENVMLKPHHPLAGVALASVVLMMGLSSARAQGADPSTSGVIARPTGPPPTSEPNSRPLGVSDQYEMFQDTTITVAAPGVLVNDSDPDGDPIAVSANEQPLDGVITVRANGAFQYTPDAGFFGFDQFHYSVTDGQGNEDFVEVHIKVNRIRPPTTTEAPTTIEAPITTIDLGTASDPPATSGPTVGADPAGAEAAASADPAGSADPVTIADPTVTTPTPALTGTLPVTGISSSVLVVAGVIVALGAGVLVTALGTAATDGLRRAARPGPRNRRR